MKERLVYGWGINDVNYTVSKYCRSDGKVKVIWKCPYYVDWKEMLRRCLDPNWLEKNPSYKGCTICEEWKYFSNFIKWVDSQPNRDWRDCEADKDIIISGNKHYGPESVVYVTSVVNSFIIDQRKHRGDMMIGVSASSKGKSKPYTVQCNDPFKINSRHIGYYDTELEAHKAWQAKKHEYACMLADMQEDPRVAMVLRQRYTPDKDWTNH